MQLSPDIVDSHWPTFAPNLKPTSERKRNNDE